MAQTLDEIYDEISVEASNYPVLSQLEANSSNLSFWHYMKRTFAFAVLQIQIIFDQLKAEILGALQLDYNVGSNEWYKMKFKEFQFGDELKVKYNTPVYETIDTTKKIIKRVSVKDNPTGGLNIKVQKEGAGGEIVALTSLEIAAFIVFANIVKIAGTLLNITTHNANIVTFNSKVYISKEVFDITGKNLITGKYDVLDYQRTYVQKNEYDEFIYLSTLYDFMNNIQGVKAFHLTGCTIDGITISLVSGKIFLPNGYGKISETDAQFNLRMSYEFI